MNWRKECFTTFWKQLHENDTAPPIIELLLEGLHAMLNNLPADTIVVNPAVANVAESQAAIGWHQILKGQLSKLWASTQDRYLGSWATVKADRSKWVTQLIESIFIE